MIIKIAVQYGANVRRKQKREFRNETFSTTIPVEIVEMSASEAPLVARFPMPNDLWSREYSKTRVVELREMGGKLIQAVEPRNSDNEISGETCDGAWVEDICLARPAEDSNPFKSLVFNSRLPGTIEEANVVEVKSTELEMVTTEAHILAADLAFVEGKLWRVVEEPRLIVEHAKGGRRKEMRGYVVPAEMPDSVTPAPSAFYRLDQSDLVHALYGDLVARHDMSLSLPEIEIFDPGMFAFKGTENMMASAAEALVEWMGTGLKSKGLAYMTAFVALRDATPAFRKALDAGEALDIEAFLPILDEAQKRTFEDQKEYYGSAGEARAAIHRWNVSNEGNDHDDVASFAP